MTTTLSVRIAAPVAAVQMGAILSGFFIGFSLATLANVVFLLVALVFIVRWAVSVSTDGTVPRQGTHRDDYTCDCWQCEAVGRWLKRPLPTSFTVDRNGYDGWLDAVTEDLSSIDAGLIRQYTTTAMTTEDFLRRWNAAPSEPAPAEIKARGRVSRTRYNGHNSQCRCEPCVGEHARRGHYWHAQHTVWMIPAWPYEGIGKGHRLDGEGAKCLGCGCAATDPAASKQCRNSSGCAYLYDDRRLAEEHAAEMRQRADNYAREFQQATGQAMSADLYGAIYHAKLTPEQIQRAKDIELARIRKRYSEQIVKLTSQPPMILGEGNREYVLRARADFDSMRARLAAIDGPHRNREA